MAHFDMYSAEGRAKALEWPAIAPRPDYRMPPQELERALRRAMGLEFAKMGFFLEHVRFELWFGWHARAEMAVVCPCGGIECFTWNFPIPQSDRVSHDLGVIARGAATYLKEHLAAEVKSGVLPPEWLERIK